MTTVPENDDASRQRLEQLALGTEPATLAALYGGSPHARRRVVMELVQTLQEQQRAAMLFNGRRHLNNPQVWVPLMQQLLQKLVELSGDNAKVVAITERLTTSLDELVGTDELSSKRIEVMRDFDTAIRRLVSKLVRQPPLVVIVQGLDMAKRGTLLDLLEFMAGFLDITGCLFITSLNLRSLEADLKERYGETLPFDASEFLEDVSPYLISLTSDEKTAAPAIPETPSGAAGAPASTPAPAPGIGLTQLYHEPELQSKLNALRNLQPEIFQAIEQEPRLLVSLERLIRGDNTPALLQQMAASDVLRRSYQDGNLRAILAREPYFDPSPIAARTQASGGVVSVDEGPRFEPSRGLESQSGAEIARRRRNGVSTPAASTPDDDDKPARKKKIIRKRKVKGRKNGKNGKVRKVKGGKKVVKKAVQKSDPEPPLADSAAKDDLLKSFVEPIESGDFLAARELWTRFHELDEEQQDQVVERYAKATRDNSPRIRATAAAAIGAAARGIMWEIDSEATDALLRMTSDAVKEVRDAAAEALSIIGQVNSGAIQPPSQAPAIGEEAPPQFQVSGDDIPQFTQAADSAPEFKPLEDTESGDEATPAFKPVTERPKFKPIE